MSLSQVTNSGSRSLIDREPSVIDYNPTLSSKYQRLFLEAACAVTFLSLEQQVTRLNTACLHTRNMQVVAQAEGRTNDYADLAKNIAALLLLRDLLRIGWKMTLAGPSIQLYRETDHREGTEFKQAIRQSMSFERDEIVQSGAVRAFVRMMERTRIIDDRPRSILSLMANGPQLHKSLQKAVAQDGENRIALLRRTIKPYLELVTPDKADSFTGYKLLDIWRYFRMTWATPYRSTPGRKLFYLVRDRGQPNHPVMGIAALANTVIGLKCRDDRIGWTPDAIADRLRHAKEEGEAKFHSTASEIAILLETHLQTGLDGIALDGLTTPHALLHPSWETVAHLQALALTASDERYELLRQEALALQEPMDAPDLEMVAPEAAQPLPPSADRYDRESSKALFRRKRATKLARLLEAKLVMQQKGVFDRPAEGLPALLWNDAAWTAEYDQGRSALRTVLNANKESKVGTSMMEIIVCGAVAPYNAILGGKLIAMLLTSPQVVRDYEARYGEQVSMIASQMAGADVTRPARLAYLGTTSLYVSEADKERYKTYISNKKSDTAARKEPFLPKSATQYNRLRIPAEVVGGHGEVRYECIGLTEGFGVVHFSADTCEALEQLDIILHSAKRINSVFGEGTSPRLRKIRQGIDLLGLHDRFLVHGQARLVYAINLAHNTERYLNGEDPEPDYILKARTPGRETDKIARYWIDRWLASRLNYAPALEAVQNFDSRRAAIGTQFHQTEELRLDV